MVPHKITASKEIRKNDNGWHWVIKQVEDADR
jgi:hypothetical protein